MQAAVKAPDAFRHVGVPCIQPGCEPPGLWPGACVASFTLGRISRGGGLRRSELAIQLLLVLLPTLDPRMLGHIRQTLPRSLRSRVGTRNCQWQVGASAHTDPASTRTDQEPHGARARNTPTAENHRHDHEGACARRLKRLS